MIYKMLRAIATDMASRGYPVAFIYGPEIVVREGCASLSILVERDDQGGDTFAPVTAPQRNALRTFNRMLGVRALFEVSSTLEGARRNEHEHECDDLVDGFVTALYAWAKANQVAAVEFVESRYLSAEERDGSIALPGVVYLLRFRVARGVTRKDYDGSALASQDGWSGTSAEVLVSRDGGDYEEVS
jgi:hypothetical protein